MEHFTELAPLSDDERERAFNDKVYLPQVTVRATVAGLLIGTVVMISNFQFGLQTGWVSMMSLPSALLGYAAFKYSPFGEDFTDVENVYVQSIAVAVGTGPLAYGLVGIIPAIEKILTPEETNSPEKLQCSLLQLMVWLAGLAFLGVFFAIPLRKQVIVKEKLPFPSGKATATLISVLYGTESKEAEESLGKVPRENHGTDNRDNENILKAERHYRVVKNLKVMKITFYVSSLYTVVSYFIPALKTIPFLGSHLSENYNWNFQPSPAYIGQGMIMGLPTVSYMLFGAVLGWGILAPLAKFMGWAPGDPDDPVDGSTAWILWISLSVMISDSLFSLVVITCKAAVGFSGSGKANRSEQTPLIGNVDSTLDSDIEHVPSSQLISIKWAIVGLLVSSLICLASLKYVFGPVVPGYAILISIILAIMFSVLGARALGETDLNPVSGIGKLSQFIFATVIPSNHPSRVLINVIAGGVAEAGAQQAGDMMQDLKTGYLLGSSPRALFIGQMIGTIYSVFISSVMYKVYNLVYDIPSEVFRIPTAVIWVDTSRLVTGVGLAPKSFEFCMFFAIIFGLISAIKNLVPSTSKYHRYLFYLPNGVAVGIGIYCTPNFTLARFLGGCLAYWWMKSPRFANEDRKVSMTTFSSGLVLGEGLFSCLTIVLTNFGVGHL